MELGCVIVRERNISDIWLLFYATCENVLLMSEFAIKF
ncbi:hypothetical protein Tsp_08360 [Trichinella spiralis]|nr:hypothetical protein Tsp_08360 [Trichinella spiralis]